jgi:hypothetical protein
MRNHEKTERVKKPEYVRKIKSKGLPEADEIPRVNVAYTQPPIQFIRKRIRKR